MKFFEMCHHERCYCVSDSQAQGTTIPETIRLTEFVNALMAITVS